VFEGVYYLGRAVCAWITMMSYNLGRRSRDFLGAQEGRTIWGALLYRGTYYLGGEFSC
jgi:hypothetical protein